MILRNNIIIAIDGHSSCGKSTLAKDIARELSYKYIDSGAMYRAVTLYALRNGLIINGLINEKGLLDKLDEICIDFNYNNKLKRSETILNGQNIEDMIRGIEVSSNVSPVSKIGFVREKLVALQQKMGQQKCIVMDGRDIGTVVFPNAELKIFLTASPEVRAKRRFDELIAKGEKVDYEEILVNVKTRDMIDSTREIAPLKKAEDAIELDNSNLSVDGQFEWALNLIQEKFM